MQRVNAASFRWTMDAAGDWLCIQTNKARQVLGSLKEGKVYDVEIKEHREKRSLDSNAYAWLLIDRLAEKLRIPKTENILAEVTPFTQAEFILSEIDKGFSSEEPFIVLRSNLPIPPLVIFI